MKTKKKLLLMGVGAMSALAIGVGATSTFAWYTTSAKASVSTISKGNMLSSGTSTVAVDSVSVTVTLSGENDGTELITSADKTGAYINGQVQERTVTSDWNKYIGTISGAATFSADPQQQAALKNGVWAHGQFTAEGNAYLLASDSSSTASGTQSGGTYTLNFADDGNSAAVAITGTLKYYCIRPNNPYGMEIRKFDPAVSYKSGDYVSNGGKIYLHSADHEAGVWDTTGRTEVEADIARSTTYTKGVSIVKHDSKYYVRKGTTVTTGGDSDPSWEAGDWEEVIPHENDKLVVTAVAATSIA